MVRVRVEVEVEVGVGVGVGFGFGLAAPPASAALPALAPAPAALLGATLLALGAGRQALAAGPSSSSWSRLMLATGRLPALLLLAVFASALGTWGAPHGTRYVWQRLVRVRRMYSSLPAGQAALRL